MGVAGAAAADQFGIGWRPELAAGILANRDRLDVVEVIIEAYLALAQERSPQVPTAAEIAHRAGYSVRSVFERFPDIHALQDMGFMYLRTFADPDGNVFEPLWMDPQAMQG